MNVLIVCFYYYLIYIVLINLDFKNLMKNDQVFSLMEKEIFYFNYLVKDNDHLKVIIFKILYYLLFY